MRVPNYKLLELLSSGGMGSVYLAQDERLPRKVAIKVVKGDGSEEAHRRLVTEARIAAALSHPNICTVFEVGETDEGRPFIVMEYLSEPSLVDVRLSAAQVLEVGIQAADALAEAHSHDVVHRDMKPANLVRTKRGHLKVLDFGIAATRASHGLALDEESDDVSTASRGAGTLAFMSPEQVRREPLDHRTDIFSLGATLYALATGRSPFVGASVGAVCRAICSDSPLPPSTVDSSFPREFDLVIETAMQKRPKDRFASASAMKSALEVASRSLSQNQPEANSRSSVPVRRAAAHFDRPRLVVLPLEVTGPDPADRALGYGIANVVSAAVGQAQFGVGSRYCVLPMSDIRARDVRTIEAARIDLGASLVLTGVVSRATGSTAVVLQLVDATDERVLKSARIERDGSVAFLEDQILHLVLQLLEIDADSATLEETRSLGSTRDATAYSYYLSGVGHLMDFQDPDRVHAAIRDLERSVAQDSDFALAHAKLGEAHWRLYEHTKRIQCVERAKEHCRRAFELERSMSQVHITLGLIAKGIGRTEEALESLMLARSAEGTSPEISIALGRVHEALGDFESAEQALLLAVQLKPDYWGSHNAYGAYLYRRGRSEDALAQFQEVVRLIPESGWGYSNLGSLYHAIGQYDDAGDMLKQSYDRRRDYTTASNLGTLYWGMHDFEEARRWFSEALSINDRDHRIWGYRGVCTYYLDRPDPAWRVDMERAIELAEAELDVDPSSDSLKAHIASYFAHLGNETESTVWMSKMSHPESWPAELHLVIAVSWRALGDIEKARSHIEEARIKGVSESLITRDPVLSGLVGGE